MRARKSKAAAPSPRRFGIMATYPARTAQVQCAVASIAPQLDELCLVLNEYDVVPSWVAAHDNISAVRPTDNLKDEGKFYRRPEADDLVYLLDDDLLYPEDYAEVLAEKHRQYHPISAIVGLHGVIYPEFWDGEVASRITYTFNRRNDAPMLVNQLGSGTLVARGDQIPPHDFMRGSAGYVDVRLALHAARNGIPMIAIERPAEWLRQIPVEESIYTGFTSHWNPEILREVVEFGGFSHLGRHAAAFHPLAEKGVRLGVGSPEPID